MQLTILGSGTCVPGLKRNGPANFLQIGKKKILVDCGLGSLLQLERAGESYKDIDLVFITHTHVDHICELPSLIWVLKWTPGFVRKKNLLIVGYKGFKEFYYNVIEKMSKKPNTFKIIVKEMKKRMVFDDFAVENIHTLHTPISTAFKFIHKNKSLVISGDTDINERLIRFSKNADLLVLECSFPNNKKCKLHLIPRECGEIAKRANVKKLLLTHLYPASPETRLEETKMIFKNTIIAKDLMKINI
ncbi:MBL fold metallo-hydrolase [Candidatus Woesearchaeota archaeon]|nr:MBL fold metallo-hydrolase [Candidatus Woesearchaeota archaeon]